MAAARQKEMNVSATEEATTIRTRLEGGKIWEPDGILSRPAAGFVPASVRADRVQWFACSTLRSGRSSVNVDIVIVFEQQGNVFKETNHYHNQRSEYSDEEDADRDSG